jgi:hypothetical protein
MKVTTRMILRSALYTVLLSLSTMLAADGGGETPSIAATIERPGLTIRLDDEQLDAVKAGQLVELPAPPEIGGDAALVDLGQINVDADKLLPELPLK